MCLSLYSRSDLPTVVSLPPDDMGLPKGKTYRLDGDMLTHTLALATVVSPPGDMELPKGKTYRLEGDMLTPSHCGGNMGLPKGKAYRSEGGTLAYCPTAGKQLPCKKKLKAKLSQVE